PLKFGQYLAENIACAEFVPVEGAGHMLAMEQSQLVGEAIGDFIDRRLTNRWLTDKH
ncbi:MAG: alpha/beta fold hydrolase, partial [Candidatus Promineifilaceae bacterium]